MPEFDFQRKMRERETGPRSGGIADAGDAASTSQIPVTRAMPAVSPAPPSFTPSSHAAGERWRGPADVQATTVVPAVLPAEARPSVYDGRQGAVPMPAPATGYGAGASVRDQAADEGSPRGGRKGGSIMGWFTKPAKHGFLSFFLWVATLCAVGVMSLRMLPEADQSGRALPEIIAFVPLFGIVSAVVLVLALLWRRRVLVLVSLACVVVQVVWHIGFFAPTARVSDEARRTVESGAVVGDNVARLMTLNTKEGNADADAIVAMVREENVEILALQEVTQSLLDRLAAAGLYDVLPYYVTSVATDSDNGGMNGVWSMAPMSSVSQSLLPIETSQMPAGTVMLGDVPVRFVSAHPNSPTRGKQSLWSEGLDTVGDLKDYDWTYVIMGDFNSSWDHPRFRSLLGDTFVDAGEQSGEGFHFTYPGDSAIPALIEIDHIVHDKSVVVSDLDTADIAGADHKALLGTLEVPVH